MEMSPGGESQSVTLVFQGLTGALVGIGRRAVAAHTLEAAPGDTGKDASVDGTDLTRVVEALGTATDGGAAEGDVTLDGAVDGADVALVVEEWGAQLYLEVDPDLGTCGPETSRIDAFGESVCVEVVARSVQGAVLEFATTPYDILRSAANPCGAKIAACLQDPEVFAALQRVVQRCSSPGSTAQVIGYIHCGPCGENFFGGIVAICGPPGPSNFNITLCDNCPPEDVCRTLAHELVHVAQACEAGVFGPDCEEFNRRWYNKFGRICMELEAYQASGDCPAATDCCDVACRGTAGSWRGGGKARCIECCQALVEHGCCNSGVLRVDCTNPTTGRCSTGGPGAP